MNESKNAGDALDGPWLSALRAGDEETYACLFREYFPSLRDYAYRYVRSWDDASDIVQQVFVNLYETRERLTLQYGIRSYLFGAVHHRALNMLRHARVRHRWQLRQVLTADLCGDQSRTKPDAALIREEELTYARHLINELPDRCRDVFLLVRLEGLSYDEAAAALGVARSTIQTHMVRAAKILSKLAQSYGLIDARPETGRIASSEPLNVD